ncbi:hypothetical protein C7451_11656 [Blastomonas natatoria]|uniref:Uncharacterized protein n=1 Tax=Blastomonas natatoria TaxID=34015 RepID=A0A2V3URZ2_9SPHN|nr:hypothetical protein [Blastomonas natatoria]PXW69537.1 hypothetical protein C7451_11656 [Blastomonas natatoria]
MNETVEHAGARRLPTVMEKLLEQISFNAMDHCGKMISIDADYVRQQLSDIVNSTGISK